MSDLFVSSPELSQSPRIAETFGIDLSRAHDIHKRLFDAGAPDLYITDHATNQPVKLRVYGNDGHAFTFGISLFDEIKEKPEQFFVDSTGGHVMILDHAGKANLKHFDDEDKVEYYAGVAKRIVESEEVILKLQEAEKRYEDARLKSKLGRFFRSID